MGSRKLMGSKHIQKSYSEDINSESNRTLLSDKRNSAKYFTNSPPFLFFFNEWNGYTASISGLICNLLIDCLVVVLMSKMCVYILCAYLHSVYGRRFAPLKQTWHHVLRSIKIRAYKPSLAVQMGCVIFVDTFQNSCLVENL